MTSLETREDNELTFHDLMREIFTSGKAITQDPSEASNKWSVGGLGLPTPLVLLDHLMILRPEEILVGTALGRNSSRVLNTYHSGSAVGLKAGATPGLGTVSGGQYLDKLSDKTKMVWIPDNEAEFRQEGGDISTIGVAVERHLPVAVVSGCTSDFRLRTNQPISFQFVFWDPSPEKVRVAMKQMVNGTSLSMTLGPVVRSVFDHIFSGLDGIGTGAQIILGGEKSQIFVSVFSDRKVTVHLSNGSTSKFVGGGYLPIRDTGGAISLVIYPIGEFLYIFDPSAIPSAPGEIKIDAGLRFRFDKVLNIAESTVRLLFWGGGCTFQSYPVMHQASGSLTSRHMKVNFDPKKRLGSMTYMGKVDEDGSLYPGPEVGDITFPRPRDTKRRYNYLSGPVSPKLSMTVNKVADNTYTYQVNLTAGGAGTNKAALESYYSPGVAVVDTTFLPGSKAIKFNPDPQIDNGDVMAVSIREHVEGATATIVLNNRIPDGNPADQGIYTPRPGINTMVGVKPIRVQVGWSGETDVALENKTANAQRGGEAVTETRRMYTHFTGYMTKVRPDRPSPEKSTCTLECVDRSKQLRESYAVSLPFFDGWCVLAVIYVLAKEAGFSDDEIMFWQDPVTGEAERLRDIIIGDPEARDSGCFAGHPAAEGGFPKRIKSRHEGKLSGAFVHQTLPSSFLYDPALFNFSNFSPIWDCMQQVRTHSLWYLYVNNFGNLVYSPPPALIRDSTKEYLFREMDPGGGNYNEIINGAATTFDTDQMRGAVFVQGLTTVATKEGFPFWTPTAVVKRQKGWPTDPELQKDPAFAPWLRYSVLSDPKWQDLKRLQFIAEEIFRRVTRNKAMVTLGAWGQPRLFPYQLIQIDESQADELGIQDETSSDVQEYLAVQIEHTITASPSFGWNTMIQAELYDKSRDENPSFDVRF